MKTYKMNKAEITSEPKPSLRVKTICNVWQSNLSETDKRCIGDVFTDYEKMKAEIERLKKPQTPILFGQDYRFCNLLGETLVFSKKLKHYNEMIKGLKTEAIKEFVERVCKERVSNDPVVIAVKTELKITEGEYVQNNK